MNPHLQISLRLAIEALHNKQYLNAENILNKVLIQDKYCYPALNILGLVKASQNQHQEASKLFTKATKLNPEDAQAQHNLAQSLFEIKRYADALFAFQKATNLNPLNPESWTGLGSALVKLGRPSDAIKAYDSGLNYAPNHPELYLNKGATHFQLREYQSAIQSGKRALEINPNLTDALMNLGKASEAIGHLEDAKDFYQKAIDFDSHSLEKLLCLGDVLGKLKLYEDSIVIFDRVLSIDSTNHDGLFKKGLALCMLQQYPDAIAYFDELFIINPLYPNLYQWYLSTATIICNWDLTKNLLYQLETKQFMLHPFTALSLIDAPDKHLKLSQDLINATVPKLLSRVIFAPRDIAKKIRIAYFSLDFRNHAVAHLIAGLIENHNRELFEIIAFSYSPVTNDEMQIRLKNGFDQFIDISQITDEEAAKTAQSMSIDIAVDLAGLTHGARTGIFFYRPAPIQVNYLGYPGTMGSRIFDYIIADPIAIPEDQHQFYEEKIVYLPDSYQANDGSREKPTARFSKSELGLPEVGFIFSCFNNNYKISEEIWQVWMRILSRVEKSVLWLFEDNIFSSENLHAQAINMGIDKNRIIFAKRMPHGEHVSRQMMADLFLDTIPYNAHTTASDALWAGLPVLTCAGKSFASRVAASLLHSLELDELITSNLEDYENAAILLATNQIKLHEIKLKLQQNLHTKPLFDTKKFTRNIERSYLEMLIQYDAKLSPVHIDLRETAPST